MTRPPDEQSAAKSRVSTPELYAVRPSQQVTGRVRPPGSKSITNRALVVAALATGRSVLNGALASEDTEVMIRAWNQLGVSIHHDIAAASIDVTGCGGRIPANSAQLFLANSGTSMRFLAAAVALGHGTFRLDGTSRMRERPIGELLRALRALGADTETELETGCPPVVVRAAGLRGGPVSIAGGESSQFTSAVLMAAPYADRPIAIEVTGAIVSEPFVAMTTKIMSDFGVSIESAGCGSFRVPAGIGYHGRTYAIEPDATAASYFWAAAAITGGRVTVEGLDHSSVQGDMAFLELLERMGAEVIRGDGATTVIGRRISGIAADMRAISDTVPTLAVVAAFADGPTTIRGVEHIRAQETDRIRAVVAELRRMGVDAEEHSDGLTVRPTPARGAAIETYNDHRIAMSFAVAGLRVPGIVITNPGCTAKTYPNFFCDFESIQCN